MAGVEKDLTGIPGDLSRVALKIHLGNYFRGAPLNWPANHDFEVLFDDSAETVVAKVLFGVNNPTKTARIIIPTVPGGLVLANGVINVPMAGQQVQINVADRLNPETPTVKYDHLRNTAYPYQVNEPIPNRIPDWTLGTVINVQCGNFDNLDQFTPDRTFIPPAAPFNKFSVFFEEAPAKFQVCLQETNNNGVTTKEYMDLHVDDNIRGVIFEAAPPHNQAVVYFIADKAPQFYHYSTEVPPAIVDPVAEGRDFPVDQNYNPPVLGIKKVRIRYPTVFGARNADLDVCNVPWEIQYSRVYKVTYTPEPADRFTFRTLVGTLAARQPRPATSPIILEQNVVAVNQNPARTEFSLVQSLFTINSLPHGWRLAVLKLLYNRNILLAGGVQAVVGALDARLQLQMPVLLRGQASRHKIADLLEQSAHDMETCHIRTLRRFHNAIALQNGPRDPPRLFGALVEPGPAIDNMAKTRFLDLSSANELDRFTTFKLMVYPSHLELYGPEVAPSSTVTRAYHALSDRFIRVRFLENDGNPFKFEPNVNPDLIIRERILNVLNQDPAHKMFPIPQFDFEYLGYSVSSLKKRKMVWFFRPHHLRIDNLDANEIRNSIGEWKTTDPLGSKLSKYPFKWGARIALAFTSSIEIRRLLPRDWAKQADTPNTLPWKAWPNSDGCGLISADFCRAINDRMTSLGYTGAKAYQIRFGGVKGVVYTGADPLFDNDDARGKALFLRDSNVKFNVPGNESIPFQVVSTTGDFKQSVYFESLIQTLENLGAYGPRILQEFNDAYGILTNAGAGMIEMLQQIVGMAEDDRDAELMSRHALLKLAVTLEKQGGVPLVNFGANSFLTQYLKHLSSWALRKNLFAIPITGSCSVLGLTDDNQIIPGKRSKNNNNQALQEDRNSPPYKVIVISQRQFIEGDVLIYRDPIIHVGDLKIARALPQQEISRLLNAKHGPVAGAARLAALAAMDNVIFFSQFDRAPLPNLLSGGDLDGDRFEVIRKDQCSFWDTAPIQPVVNPVLFYHQPSSDYAPLDPPDPLVPVVPDLPDAPPEADLPIVLNPPANNGPVFPSGKSTRDFDINDLTTFISRYIRNDCFDELQTTLIALADVKQAGMMDADVKAFSDYISTAVDYAKGGIPANLQQLATDPRFKVVAKPSVIRARNQVLRYDQSGDYYNSGKLIGSIFTAGEQAATNIDAALAGAQVFNDQAIRANIDGIRNGIALAGANIANYINPMMAAINPIIQDGVGTYRQYLVGRNIRADNEMSVFMVKPRDAAFPENFIDQIEEVIKVQMEAQGALQHVPAIPGQINDRFQYGNVNAANAAIIFAQAAWKAWETALNEAAPGNPGLNYDPNYGVSYAYLCLYVCYCRKLTLA